MCLKVLYTGMIILKQHPEKQEGKQNPTIGSWVA